MTFDVHSRQGSGRDDLHGRAGCIQQALFAEAAHGGDSNRSLGNMRVLRPRSLSEGEKRTEARIGPIQGSQVVAKAYGSCRYNTFSFQKCKGERKP